MNALDQIDLEILAAIQRERPAEMRREAWNVHQLQSQNPTQRGNNHRLQRLLVVLCFAIPIIVMIVRAVAA